MRRERPERAASPQPRATPWVPEYKAPRPVRAKAWAHLLFIAFALTGRRCGTYVNPGRCPGLRTCWAFSPRRAARLSRSAKIRLIRNRRERPERAASPQPRATPWVPRNKTLRPVRAKVWAHLLFITFALTGRRGGTYVNPGRCPGLRTCWAFSPCRVARMSRICGASAPEGAARMSRNRKIRSIRPLQQN